MPRPIAKLFLDFGFMSTFYVEGKQLQTSNTHVYFGLSFSVFENI